MTRELTISYVLGIEFKRAAQKMRINADDVILPRSTWQCPSKNHAVCDVIFPYHIIIVQSLDRLLKATCDEWSKVQPEELWDKHWFMAFDMFYMQDNLCVLHSLMRLCRLISCSQYCTRRFACQRFAAAFPVGHTSRAVFIVGFLVHACRGCSNLVSSATPSTKATWGLRSVVEGKWSSSALAALESRAVFFPTA
jgi:hypothetical protein